MAYRFYTADVFTDRIFGGNPLAVFPDGRGLDDRQMQSVAREFNLSETVFVLPPERPEHTRRLRIFTPGTELPFAGHPTVGTAHVLASIGELTLEEPVTQVIFEEGVGPVPVGIRVAGGQPEFAQLSAAQMPEFGPSPPPAARLAEMLSLDPADFVDDAEPAAVSCGVPFLFVALTGLDAMGRAKIRRDIWESVLADYWAPSVFLFCEEAETDSSDLHGRMFAPAMGIVEDPATGAAATALGGLLATRDAQDEGTLRWVVEQGFEMGRPSILDVEADKAGGTVTAIRVGGASVLVSRGEMEIPESP